MIGFPSREAAPSTEQKNRRICTAAFSEKHGLQCGFCTPSPGDLGRTVIAIPSMANCATNFSTAKSSTAQGRLPSSSSNGVNTTTRYDPTHRRSIRHRRRMHRRRKGYIQIGTQRCSSLYLAGLKYPSGQCHRVALRLDVLTCAFDSRLPSTRARCG